MIFRGSAANLPQKYRDKATWRPIVCAGFDDHCKACGHVQRKPKATIDDIFEPKCVKCGAEVERKFHHFEMIECDCQAGPQLVALLTPAYEVGMHGGRGGAKTTTGYAFTARGNPKGNSPTDQCYFNNPNYRVLVLRKNAKDLGDWWGKAKKFYGLYGGEPNDSDKVIKFPSGAELVADHLANEDAFEKYQGQEFQTIWIEEASQISSEKLYEQVRMSCRSTIRELVARIFLTWNPGGRGGPWLKARFITNRIDRQVYRNKYTKRTRIAIHSTCLDNPYWLRDEAWYVRDLVSIKDETLRKQWLEGDAEAFEGQFFTEFRDVLNPLDKNPNALHVVPAGSVQFAPYWDRWISMDVGYAHNSAVFWFCRHADTRVYTYREQVAPKVGMREWGVRIAQASLSDLEGLEDHHMTMYLSPDAFLHNDETNSRAQQIAEGIADVLGPNGVFLMDFNAEEELMPKNKAWESLMRRKEQRQTETGITIVRAMNDRVAGWSLMREALRWWPLIDTSNHKPDPDVIRSLLETQGVLAYREYMRHFEQAQAEVLPKWRILDCCPKAIQGMKALQYKTDTEDAEKQDGDDAADACFVAGTKILTQRGEIPIETVKVGDLALTRSGWKKIIWSGETGTKETVTVELSDGRMLHCTPNHPIFINGRGFVPAVNLKTADLCESNLSYLAVPPIKDTRNLKYGPAPDYVRRVFARGMERVYNLTVAEQPEYFANGVLVHNCRYGLAADTGKQRKTPKPFYVQERIAAVAATSPSLSMTSKVMIGNAAAHEYDRKHTHSQGFYVPRGRRPARVMPLRGR